MPYRLAIPYNCCMAQGGIEPPTHRASTCCSTGLSYRAEIWHPQHFRYLMLVNLTTNKFLNIRRVQSDGYCSRILLLRNCTSKAKGFILVTGVAPASLPLIEATVNSVLYGVWRAWQLTRYLAKALSRCVCCVPPHKFSNNFYDNFDIRKSPLSPSFSD